MKMNLTIKISEVVLVFLFASASFAQEGDKNVKQKIIDKHGNVSMISFYERSTYKNSDFQQVFKDQLVLKEESSFKRIEFQLDSKGFLHEKYQLFHKGIKAEFVTYYLHSKQGKLISMNGESYSLENINTTPRFSKELAFEYAKRHIGAKEYLWEKPQEAAIFNYKKPEGELVLLPVFGEGDSVSGDLKLAFKYDIYATNPVSRGDIYIDAVNGDVLLYNASIKHLGEFSNGKGKQESVLFRPKSVLVSANSDTRYSNGQVIQTTLSGSSYVLSDATRGLGINTYDMQKGTFYSNAINFADSDNNWSAAEYHNADKDDGALDAHWGAGRTYDYWKTIHGRNSYNNAGAAIDSYVHFGDAYNNAYWNGSVMTYGDGSGAGGFDILTSLDVCAHEIAHGVCSSTANLAYQRESGALNESLSDIWGACVEHFAAPNDIHKQTWVMGEEIEMRSGHIGIRSMSDPNSEGQPDTYGGAYWRDPSCVPTSNNDYCGVHTNSGVLNYWFYLLTMGGTGTNDIGSNYSVSGIGMGKAANIAFRMENVYLTANSTYTNARTYAIQSAADLYGLNSPEQIATTNAFYAVGVGPAYIGPGDTEIPSTPLNLTASGTTQSSTNLSWSPSTDNIGVTGYNVYQDGSKIATVTTVSYTVTGLSVSTGYSFTVKARDAAGNLSAVSNTVTVNTAAASAYCTPNTGATNHRIGKVVFGTINNTSTGTAGYENFSSLTTAVNRGRSYTVTITPTKNSNSREGYAVFVDFNGDGDFTDTGERVWTKSATNANSVNGTFTIPSAAKLGITRMRVSMKNNGVPSSCEIFANGQVEDYSLNVLQAAAVQPGIVAHIRNLDLSMSLYPNPVDDYLNVTMSGNEKETFYTIVNQIGQEVQRGKLDGNGIEVNELASGIYFLRADDGNQMITKKFIKR